jgi:hypothetical protein
MKHNLVIVFALASWVIGFAADSRDDGTWEFFSEMKSSTDEKITVRIITGPWEASEHKIETNDGTGWKTIPKPIEIDSAKETKYRIDGQEQIYGADGFGWPDREVKLFVVQWSDRTINVPRKHWRNYYWLLLYTVEETKKNSDIGGCWTKSTIDSKTGDLVIVANGGGGAGWYRATWRIKPDGTIWDSAEHTAE